MLSSGGGVKNCAEEQTGNSIKRAVVHCIKQKTHWQETEGKKVEGEERLEHEQEQTADAASLLETINEAMGCSEEAMGGRLSHTFAVLCPVVTHAMSLAGKRPLLSARG